MKKTLMAMALVAVLASPAAFAAEKDYTVGVNAGTTGLGVDFSYNYNDKLSATIGFNGYSYAYDLEADNIEYDGEINLQTISVLGNYHPFGGKFRLTGGIVHNGNTVSLQAYQAPGVSYTIGDTTYSDELTLDGELGFKDVAPYVGIGWGHAVDKNWGLSADLGVLYHGTPDLTLTADGAATLDPTFDAEFQKEKANAEDDIAEFKYYPVAKVGLFFRF